MIIVLDREFREFLEPAISKVSLFGFLEFVENMGQ